MSQRTFVADNHRKIFNLDTATAEASKREIIALPEKSVPNNMIEETTSIIEK